MSEKKYLTHIEDMDFSAVQFANEKLEFLSPLTIINDYSHIRIDTNQSVDLRNLVGTSFDTYAEYPFYQYIVGVNGVMFKGMERGLEDLKKTPEYFVREGEKIPPWSFYQVVENDKESLFIEDGQHRTIIARFFFALNNIDPIVHGVSVIRIKRKE